MGYIFEQEIESIINVVRTKTIGEGDEIRLRSILKSPIHASIKAYFRAEVEKIFQQEREKENRSKRLPYESPEVVSLQKQIDKLLILNYHFTRDEFDTLLDESVHFQFNYLCRPQWTLLNFIFGTNRVITTSVIESRLKCCVDYSYIPYLIKRYIEEHGYTEIKYEDFQALLKKIDNEIIAIHNPEELARMLRPLFAFLESTLPPQAEERTIPINAAIVFFEDKRCNNIQQRLEIERDLRGSSDITLQNLIDILQSAYSNESPAVEKEEVKEQLLSIVNEENTSESSSPSTSVSENQESALSEISSEPIQANPTTLEITISSWFPKNIREKIVRKLFHKNEGAFQKVLAELEESSQWADVAHYLDAFFITNDIDPFEEAAVLFTDTLYDYYHRISPSN